MVKYFKAFFTFFPVIFLLFSVSANAQRARVSARKNSESISRLTLADHTCSEAIEIFRDTNQFERIVRFEIHRDQVAFDVSGYDTLGNQYLSRVYSYNLTTQEPAVRIDDGSAQQVWALEIHDGGIAYAGVRHDDNRDVLKIHQESLANGQGQVTFELPPSTRARSLRGGHDFASGRRYFFYLEYGLPYRTPAQLKICELPGPALEQRWSCRPFSESVSSGPLVWADSAEPMLWGSTYPMFQLVEFQNTALRVNRHLISGPMGNRFIDLGEPNQNFKMLTGNEVYAVFVREETREVEEGEIVFNQLVLGYPDQTMRHFVELTPWQPKGDSRFDSASISHGPSAFQSIDGKMKIAFTEIVNSSRPTKILKISYMDWIHRGVMSSFEVAEDVLDAKIDGDWVVYLKNIPQVGGIHEVLYARRCWFNR